MSTLLNFGRDVQGYNAFAPQFPTDIFTATLADGTAESIVVPTNFPAWIMTVSITPGNEVWVSRTTTAAIPAGGSFAASKSELNPGPRLVYSGDTISFITPNTTTDCEVAFYAVSYQ
jgi:hypothetical protein